MNNPIERMYSLYDSLSRTQQHIADLLLGGEDAVCFMSLNELSDKAGVTAVTVMNFVKKLGYKNYSDFKKEYRNYVQVMLSPRSIAKENWGGDSTTLELLERLRRSEKNLMEETYAAIGDDHLLAAVGLLKQARRIYLTAKNMTASVACAFQKRIAILGLDSELLTLDNLKILSRTLARTDESDVFVVFSFPNYLQCIGNVARCARQRGCGIICLTDKTTSPPACYADVVLLCQTATPVFYNSMTSVLSIMNVLVTLLAVEAKERLAANEENCRLMASYLQRDEPDSKIFGENPL